MATAKNHSHNKSPSLELVKRTVSVKTRYNELTQRSQPNQADNNCSMMVRPHRRPEPWNEAPCDHNHQTNRQHTKDCPLYHFFRDGVGYNEAGRRGLPQPSHTLRAHQMINRFTRVTCPFRGFSISVPPGKDWWMIHRDRCASFEKERMPVNGKDRPGSSHQSILVAIGKRVR